MQIENKDGACKEDPVMIFLNNADTLVTDEEHIAKIAIFKVLID